MGDENKPSTELNQLISALTNALKPAQSRPVLPTWDADVSLWLSRVDNAFKLGTRTSESEKAAAIADKLPSWLFKILAPQLSSIHQAEHPYSEIQKIINLACGKTELSKIKKKYHLIDCQGKTPLQILAELEDTWGDTNNENDKREVFILSLPQELRFFANSIEKSKPLSEVAIKCQEKAELTKTNQHPSGVEAQIQELTHQINNLTVAGAVNTMQIPQNISSHPTQRASLTEPMDLPMINAIHTRYQRERSQSRPRSRSRQTQNPNFRPPDSWCTNHKLHLFECRFCQRRSIQDPHRCHFPNDIPNNNNNNNRWRRRSPTPGNARGRF